MHQFNERTCKSLVVLVSVSRCWCRSRHRSSAHVSQALTSSFYNASRN